MWEVKVMLIAQRRALGGSWSAVMTRPSGEPGLRFTGLCGGASNRRQAIGPIRVSLVLELLEFSVPRDEDLAASKVTFTRQTPEIGIASNPSGGVFLILLG